MGTKDVTTRRLEDFNEVFADIINVLAFEGERAVQPEDLIDLDLRSEFMSDGKGLRAQERDVAKFWTNGKIRIALFAFENQSVPDPKMWARIAGYNGASYKTQTIVESPDKALNEPDAKIASENATDASLDGPVSDSDSASALESPESKNALEKAPAQGFYPVLTFVLYFGITRWNVPKSLYEAVDIPHRLKRFIPNQTINLVEIAFLPKRVINKFQSDFRVVASFFRNQRLYGDDFLDKQEPAFLQNIDHFVETMRMLSAFSHDPRFEELALNPPKTKEVNMILALSRKIDEGKREGRREGRKGMNRIYASLFHQGRGADVVRAVEDPEFLQQILDEFGVHDEDDKDADVQDEEQS